MVIRWSLLSDAIVLSAWNSSSATILILKTLFSPTCHIFFCIFVSSDSQTYSNKLANLTVFYTFLHKMTSLIKGIIYGVIIISYSSCRHVRKYSNLIPSCSRFINRASLFKYRWFGLKEICDRDDSCSWNDFKSEDVMRGSNTISFFRVSH